MIVNRHAKRDFGIACAAAVLLTAAFGIWIGLRIDGIQVTEAVDDFGEAAAALIAALACAAAALRHKGRMRVAWALLGSGAAAWAIGEGIWSYIEVIRGQQVPFPSLADAGYLAAVPLVVAGIAVFPGRHRIASRAAFLLDGAIIAGALLIISWSTVLGMLYRAGSGDILSIVLGLAYPVSDIAIAVTALLLVSRTARSVRLPLLLVAAGLSANLLSDSAFAYLTTAQTYGPAQLIDTGWIAGYLLIGLGGFFATLVPKSSLKADDEPPGRWSLALPYVPVAIAATVTVVWNVSGSPDLFLFWGMMGVAGLVLLRQFIVLWDNLALNQKLEAQAAALRDTETNFRSLVQNSGDVVVLADSAGTMRFLSTSIDRFFAYSPIELVGQPFAELLHPTDKPVFEGGVQKALTASAHPITLSCRVRHKLGSWTHCEITITNMLHQSTLQALVLNIRDVTDRKEMEERLAHVAAHDPVTSLPNRMTFRTEADAALERSQPGRGIAVLALDIDDFKVVNDALGQRAGDDLLGMIGGRLSKIVRPGDVVARIGADEFAVLMATVVHEDQPVRLTERIFEHFRAPFRVEEREVVLRLSAGIAVQARPEDTGETLMRNADIALNAAKSAGKGRLVQYGPEQHASVSDRMELEVDLAHALERRQLVLHYQPAVRLADGAIVGFEAFVRWSHPRRGMVSPADFIPLADETGLIVPLQRWVLGQACADGRQWQLGYPVASGLTMSVNVSQRGLAHPDLVADVTQACVAARFDPLHLVLELTQGATLKGKETIDRLIELHQRGVKLALDDFGADSAPLSALRDLPVDIVKLDQSFVARMTSSPTDATVARAVIDLGNTLGMMTMADGIERAEQLVALQRIGCTAGQGYYLSRPLPASGIERLLGDCTEEAGVLRLASFKLERAG